MDTGCYFASRELAGRRAGTPESDTAANVIARRLFVGSRAFVEHSPVDLKRIFLAVNLDMVGRLRNDRMIVYGADTPYLRTLVAARTPHRVLYSR